MSALLSDANSELLQQIKEQHPDSEEAAAAAAAADAACSEDERSLSSSSSHDRNDDGNTNNEKEEFMDFEPIGFHDAMSTQLVLRHPVSKEFASFLSEESTGRYPLRDFGTIGAVPPSLLPAPSLSPAYSDNSDEIQQIEEV